MRHAMLFLVLAMSLSGCATYYWYKPEASQAVVERDSQECREQAFQLVNRFYVDDPYWWSPVWRRPWDPWWPSMPDPAAEQDVYNRCMSFKGYALIKEPKRSRASGGP